MVKKHFTVPSDVAHDLCTRHDIETDSIGISFWDALSNGLVEIASYHCNNQPLDYQTFGPIDPLNDVPHYLRSALNYSFRLYARSNPSQERQFPRMQHL